MVGNESETSSDWILTYHDKWTKATLHPFYKDCEENTLDTLQFHQFLVDRRESMYTFAALLKSMQQDQVNIPKSFMQYVDEECEYLTEYCNRANVPQDLELSYSTRKFKTLIEGISKTVDSSLFLVICIWTTMFAAQQGWRLCIMSPTRNLGPTYSELGAWFSRDSAVIGLIEMQSIMDELLVRLNAKAFKSAKVMFEESLDHFNASMDNILILTESSLKGKLVCSKCGRVGHDSSTCTFKSHI